MFPIECFSAENADKMEAVRYYIELNKEFLKETSKEDYELFADFLKGTGKDVMLLMKDAKTDKELYSLLKKLESVLPYKTSIAKLETLEKKVNAITKEFAKILVKEQSVSYTRLKGLNKQRELAEEYDNLFETINKYKTILREYNDFKENVTNQTALKQVFASKLANVKDLSAVLKSAAENLSIKVKQTRAEAFKKIREHNVNEQIYVLCQQENTK
ncbi:MAG: hypothetical protein IJW25_01005 [Clostridia bacterium]|nr:hypothetical protein [Clostridia bacterium]